MANETIYPIQPDLLAKIIEKIRQELLMGYAFEDPVNEGWFALLDQPAHISNKDAVINVKLNGSLWNGEQQTDEDIEVFDIDIYPVVDQYHSKLFVNQNFGYESYNDFLIKIIERYCSGELKKEPSIKGPWQLSKSKKKRERDRIIWEGMQAGNTREEVAEEAGCVVNTVRSNYKRMKNINLTDN